MIAFGLFSALDHGMPVTLIAESVFARCLSSLKMEREKASRVLAGPKDRPKVSWKPKHISFCVLKINPQMVQESS